VTESTAPYASKAAAGAAPIDAFRRAVVRGLNDGVRSMRLNHEVHPEDRMDLVRMSLSIGC
jgi:hypothetical protein